MAKLRILVIDDDVELCEGIAEFLRDEGYQVKDTSDAFAGQVLIDENEFDVALLDFKMTGLTGIDLVRRIRKSNSKVKVYLLTGRPFIEKLLEENNMAHMVDGVIGKPFKQNVLLEKIRAGFPEEKGS